MKKTELIRLIAENLGKNTMESVFGYIAPGCEYFNSGMKQAAGKDEVCAFFLRRKEALNREKIPCFAFSAVVEESGEDEIPAGTYAAALAQFDRYNCVGFMTVQTDETGMITRFDFNTTPAVRFKVDAPGKFNISGVPKDAHDALSRRAFAFGILDENVNLDRHVRRYDEFEDYVQCELSFIMYHVIEDFERKLTNIAGYLYISAMSAAVERERGISLFRFDETESANDDPPAVDGIYRQWIGKGFENGKALFLGFTEYVHLRHPENEILNEQLIRSFRDLMFFASVQANRDMDMGKV